MDLLHEAPNLFHRYKHGDAFRRHVQRHTPLVVFAIALFFIVSMATTAAMVVFFGGTSGFRVVVCLILAPFMLGGSLVVQAFIFFSWLERRAVDRVSGRRPRTLQEHLREIPWLLAAGFLVFPFFILGLVSIKVAATLLVIFILLPVAYSILERD